MIDEGFWGKSFARYGEGQEGISMSYNVFFILVIFVLDICASGLDKAASYL